MRVGEDKWAYAAVDAARAAPECFGGWEYYVRWRNWPGGTWETAYKLNPAPNSQLAADMEEARRRKVIPHSMRERCGHALRGTSAAGRRRSARLLTACEADRAEDGAVEELVAVHEELRRKPLVRVRHAELLEVLGGGGAWNK